MPRSLETLPSSISMLDRADGSWINSAEDSWVNSAEQSLSETYLSTAHRAHEMSLLLVITLRALSDLQSNQLVPEVCSRFLPPETVLKIQQGFSTNPIIRRDPSLRSAAARGCDLKRYKKPL